MQEEKETFESDFSDKIIDKETADKVAAIQRSFLESYVRSRDNMTVDDWLSLELQKQLSGKTTEAIKAMSAEIISSLRITEEMKLSQQRSIEAGRSKEQRPKNREYRR